MIFARLYTLDNSSISDTIKIPTLYKEIEYRDYHTLLTGLEKEFSVVYDKTHNISINYKHIFSCYTILDDDDISQMLLGVDLVAYE